MKNRLHYSDWLPLLVAMLGAWLLGPLAGRAQGSAGVLQGSVRDAGTHAPVPYASVALPGTGVGTVTNEEGNFRLVLPAGRPADSVVVSSVGYLPRRLPLLPGMLASSQVLTLTPQQYALQDVAVRGYTAQSLLSAAVRQTNRQLLSPALVSGYYREFAQTDGQYTKFADALVDYYLQVNPRHPHKPEIQVRVRESRAGEVPPTDRTASLRAVPSPISIDLALSWYSLTADNHFLDSLSFSRYTYAIQAPASGSNAPFYLISFAPATHDKNYLDRGTVRVNSQTLTIEAIDSELPAELLPYAPSINLLVIKVKLVTAIAHYEFRTLNGQLYPALARLQAGVAVSGTPGNFRCDFTSVFAATSVAAVASSPFAKNELYKGSLYKNGTNNRHPYWLENSIVLATKDEEAAIAQLAQPK